MIGIKYGFPFVWWEKVRKNKDFASSRPSFLVGIVHVTNK